MHRTRASNSDVQNIHVLPLPACWYFWQSSIKAIRLTSACHLCGLSCLKNPWGISQWWEDHFPINKWWNLNVWKTLTVVWFWRPAEGGRNVSPLSLVSEGCLIPQTDAFPFHYQKALRRPLATRTSGSSFVLSLLVLKMQHLPPGNYLG